MARLAQKEDCIMQNQMSSVTTVKAGRLRRTTLSAILSVVNLSGGYVYTNGPLGRLSSVHFDR